MNFWYGIATGFAICAILAAIVFAFQPPKDNDEESKK